MRAAFALPGAPTVGIEEEIVLLEPETLVPVPAARQVLARAGDARLKGELPAAQVEAISDPAATVGAAAAQLRSAREALARAADGIALPAGAGLHPLTPEQGELDGAERYRFSREEYGPVARLQLVSGLHVHVRIEGAERALAVYNGLRSYLPELAALGANGPFRAGGDTGFASYRPKLAELLPRQGTPPPLASLDELANELAWGIHAGVLPNLRSWWWELRLHPVLGTVEIRVADQQATVAESAAIAALVHALAITLAEELDRGRPPPVHPTWRIDANRWTAARHGLAGCFADLTSGERSPARARVAALIERVAPAAERLGCRGELEAAWRLAQAGGAEQQRVVAEQSGIPAVARHLAQRFLA